MFLKRAFLLLAVCLFFFTESKAQKNVTTVGIQYKPIFPVSFLGTGSETGIDRDVTFITGLKSGFSGGMTIRRGLSDLVGLESGINYVKRKYNLEIVDGSNNIDRDFRIIGYEIPVSFLVYIRLGEFLYMNAAMGSGIDMFASAVQVLDTNYNQVSFRNRVVQPAIHANLGWEWRTEKSGYIYLGFTYHRPFEFIYLNKTEYRRSTTDVYFNERKLNGSYLTLDLRYYFHEDPEVKKKKK
ncbi:MAG: hypothetical protein DWQ44_05840 [Bacteroidetes bacterium]|nr:MAG: hypothetical protein DWQ33_03525 [Bacteroidota bacterium]REK03542.1 MAG: hypothetical protein DWQ39_10125 [Bacteroidota bacterium]REK34845.1 MAG: hypothetical protein DWQ44_05840 [Bacteroidota bacterium]REK51216.1 MAG: hypothetical protein DWQ48_01915 [Bacteroidota bacterium]